MPTGSTHQNGAIPLVESAGGTFPIGGWHFSAFPINDNCFPFDANVDHTTVPFSFSIHHSLLDIQSGKKSLADRIAY